MRTAKYPVNLTEEERIILEQMAKRPTTAQHFVQRARIILLADAGMKHQEIAKQLATRPNVVTHWTKHRSERLNDPMEARLQDSQRSGRRPTIKPSQVCELIALACESPQAHGRPTTPWTQQRAGR